MTYANVRADADKPPREMAPSNCVQGAAFFGDAVGTRKEDCMAQLVASIRAGCLSEERLRLFTTTIKDKTSSQ